MNDHNKLFASEPGNISATALSEEDLWMSDNDLISDEPGRSLGAAPCHLPDHERPISSGNAVIAYGFDLGTLCSACGRTRLDESA